VGDWAILGGFTGVHQFVRVGAHSFCGVGTVLLQDLPPYVTVAGNPAAPHGINAEGLRRRGFSPEAIAAIRRAYKLLYRSGLTLTEARERIAELAVEQPELQPLIDSSHNRAVASSAETPSVALVAGEASGDLLGGLLLEGLRLALPGVRFWGVGGEAMQAQGFDARWSYEPLAVHGFVDALKCYPRLARFRRALVHALAAPPVDLFIGIDAPDFNLGLEAQLKRAGIGTVHFVTLRSGPGAVGE